MRKPRIAKAGKETTSKTAANNQLKSVVERIERLEADKKEISDDIREVYAEAKGNGYDIPALRALVRLRKMDPEKRAELEEVLDIYKEALGMLVGTPLGDSALERASTH
jgi:uncharacterized protein (UPF0335 family)